MTRKDLLTAVLAALVDTDHDVEFPASCEYPELTEVLDVMQQHQELISLRKSSQGHTVSQEHHALACQMLNRLVSDVIAKFGHLECDKQLVQQVWDSYDQMSESELADVVPRVLPVAVISNMYSYVNNIQISWDPGLWNKVVQTYAGKLPRKINADGSPTKSDLRHMHKVAALFMHANPQANHTMDDLEVIQVVRNPMLKRLNWSTPYMSIYFTNQKEPCAWVDESYGEAFVLPKLEKV